MEGKNRFWKGFLAGAALLLTLTLLAGTVAFFEGRAFFRRFARAKTEQSATVATAGTKDSSEQAGQETEDRKQTAAESAGDAAARLQEVIDAMDEYFVLDCNRDEMALAALKAYVEAAGDPYSQYLTAEEFTSMMEDSEGSYCGIGVRVQQDLENMQSTVLDVFSGSSAKEQGMQPGDILTAVDGTDVRKMLLDDIVKLIRGDEGSFVEISVYRSWEDKTYTFSVERRLVEVETVFYRMLSADTGYLQLTDFDAVSADQVRKALTEMKSLGMKKLVMDLRNNPGGLLNSVLQIMDFFLDKDLLTFYMKDKQGQLYRYYSKEKPVFTGEMAVLTNENSASASEVFTGAMKDYGRATIFGETTFGKGIVQSFLQLEDGSALKLTTEHYFTPAGQNIHGVGVEPDVQGTDDPVTEEDELLQLVLTQLSGK